VKSLFCLSLIMNLLKNLPYMWRRQALIEMIFVGVSTAALGIPFQPLPDYIEGAQQALYTAKKHMERTQTPYALLVKRQTFTPYKMQKKTILDEAEHLRMPREDAIHAILEAVHDRDIIVGTTGMLSRFNIFIPSYLFKLSEYQTTLFIMRFTPLFLCYLLSKSLQLNHIHTQETHIPIKMMFIFYNSLYMCAH